MKLFFYKQNDNRKGTEPENSGLVWHRKRNFENSGLNFNKNLDSLATNFFTKSGSDADNRKPQFNKGLLSIIAELEKKITRIHLSTRTLFKIMSPVHHYLRMKQSWYDRWHQTALATPTHWLTLIMVIITMFSYSFIYFYKDGGSHPKAAEPETFTSSNALYSGDFEGVNGVAGLNQGWASNDTARLSSTDFGWDKTNFTRDAHGGDFAYEVTTDTSTSTSQTRAMDFNIADEEITLSGYMKVNELVTANHGGIVISYIKNGTTAYLRLCPGLYGVPSPTTEYQLFSIPLTFTEATSNTFSIYLYGPNYLVGTNPEGSAIYFDDISLIFTDYPTYTLYSLTTDPYRAIYSGAVVNCGAGVVPVYYPDCYTNLNEEEETSQVYVRVSIPQGGTKAYFKMDGHMGGGESGAKAVIPDRYISYVPNFSYTPPLNQDLYLSPGESSSWTKLSFPYIYLNVLPDDNAAQQYTKNQPLVAFSAFSGDSMLSDAKFKVEIALDATGATILNSHDVDGASSAMISIPRHLPADGSGINFAHEEATYLDTQVNDLDLNSSTANQLTEVHFSTGHALGKDFLDDSLYDKQNWLLRRLGINGLSLTAIQGPYSDAEKQLEAESQGFSHSIVQDFLDKYFELSAFEYPLDDSKIDTAYNAFADIVSGFTNKDEIEAAWVYEEKSPPTISEYVASSTAQISFRNWLAAQGLTPADFGKSDWSEVSMVMPQNAETDATTMKEWYYTARFRSEAMTRFTNKIAPRLKSLLPNAVLCPDFTDAFFLSGNAIKAGIFWPEFARNSNLNGMMTAYYEAESGSTMTASMYSAMLRSGSARNNFELWARLGNIWPGKALKQEIYSSLVSGAKMFDFFNYGPDYLAVTDAHSYNTEQMRAIMESNQEFVPVQSEIKNSSRIESETAILYSETSDIWHWVDDARELGLDSNGLATLSSSTLERERQGIFFALENNQISTDMITEQNINFDNILDNYKILYVVGPNISLSAQQKIANWVAEGGIVYATTGAGIRDEYNRPSSIISNILGVDYSGMDINYITHTISSGQNTSCWSANLLKYLEVNWHLGHLYTTTEGISYNGYCAYMDPIIVRDSEVEIIAETASEKLFIKRSVGSGTAYYSNFFAGIAYLTKASIAYYADIPDETQSFSLYPGDDELEIMLTPFNQSNLQRVVELSGDGANSPSAVQTGVLAGIYNGKSYYLIPMDNFNQEIDGDIISRTLKVTVNISNPSLVGSVYSVKRGNLSFSKITNAIEINSFTLDDTDIIKIEFNSPTIVPPNTEEPVIDSDEDPKYSTTNSSSSSKTSSSSAKTSSTEDQTIRRVTFGQSITLEAPDIQTGYNYYWDFGDNTQANGSKVNHYYQKIDRFKAVLTTTNSSKAKIVTTYTIDVVPPPPELSKVDSNQKEVSLKGKALAGTEILITLHSDPYTTTSSCGNDGNFDKSFDFGTTGLAYGDHKISLVARSTTKEGVVLDSDAKDYDAYFNLTENNTINAGLKNISPWYKKWYWIASAILLLLSITAAATYLIIKRKGGGDIDNHGGLGNSSSVFTLQGRI